MKEDKKKAKQQETAANEEKVGNEAVAEEVGREESAEMKELAARLEEMNATVEKLQKERDSYLDAAQRLQAEFDNYRRRNVSMRRDALDEGERETVTKILPVIDNLQRAIGAMQTATDVESVSKGVTMVYDQLMATLGGIGLKEIEAEGVQFDPNFHNAVMQGDGGEDFESGYIMEVLQKGYMINDKIIRHSMVKVAE